MNLILLFDDDFISDRRVRLTGRRHRHIYEIHKPVLGETLKVGLLNGKMGQGVVTGISDETVDMAVVLDYDPPQPLEATLMIAMHRPIVLKRVLYTAAMMGVKKIIVFHSYRVEKSFWNSSLLKNEEWKDQLILGLEQACDTVMPEVIFQRKFKPFFEDEVPSLIRGTTALVAHPGGKLFCPSTLSVPLTIAVGPEGGFIDYEVDLLKKIGFMPIGLGPRILRVETAVPVLLGGILCGNFIGH
ncbi:MAG: 16S rRNA (uracil(1498)-N(3))-methyltransferase [Candidatus Omnitrophica bacterium]|nr:16S rRNA (uracil(1498)-N(3))-methyltransferase [Candidatus Omnitrophota bacterium]